MPKIQTRYGILLGLAIFIVVLPWLMSGSFHLRIASIVFIYGIAVLGLNLLMGFTGQISLGHAGFFAIGAYSVAVGPAHLGLPILASLVCGIGLSALIVLIIGVPVLRLHGLYFAVATLAIGLLISMVINNEAMLTGGPDGMGVPTLKIGNWAVRGARVWYWVSASGLLLTGWLVANLISSPTGRAMRAINDSEVAANVLGVNVPRYKLIAFVLSAAIAAAAGGLLALFNGHVTPVTANFVHSVEMVTMVVIGGMGSILGSVAGAAILVVLPQVLVAFNDYEHLVLGALMVLFMVFLRSGIVPSIAAGWGWKET